MRTDSIMFGIAGIFFGLLAGWIIGSQQAAPSPAAAPAAAANATAAPSAAALDEARVATLRSTADRNPKDAETRVELGNLYFDAERFEDALRWYQEAVTIEPRNVNASTDLGITFYYTNQPDRALEQFERSLAVDPKHSKTLLNVGIVRAFGKQDIAGAAKAWQAVLDAAPGSPEARAAKQALDGLRSAHPGVPGGDKPPGS